MTPDYLTTVILVVLGLIHWFCDFCLQTRQQGDNKSKSNFFLLAHTGTYSAMFWVILLIIGGVLYLPYEGRGLFMQYAERVTVFAGVTFVLHTTTDYITSRLNSYFWKRNKKHKFWMSLGFDQWGLHFPQLAFTWYYLFSR